MTYYVHTDGKQYLSKSRAIICCFVDSLGKLDLKVIKLWHLETVHNEINLRRIYSEQV